MESLRSEIEKELQEQATETIEKIMNDFNEDLLRKRNQIVSNVLNTIEITLADNFGEIDVTIVIKNRKEDLK